MKLVSVFSIRFLPDLDTREVLFQKIATEHSGFVYFKVSAESYEVGEMCTLQLQPGGSMCPLVLCRAGGVTINTASVETGRKVPAAKKGSPIMSHTIVVACLWVNAEGIKRVPLL